MYSECREGRKVKSLARVGGEAGTGKGKMLWVELGRRWKNQLDRCRKVSGGKCRAGLACCWAGLCTPGSWGPHTHSGASSLFHRVLSSLRTGLQVSALLRCPSYTVVGPEEILAA